jgi:hypothetical protein
MQVACSTSGLSRAERCNDNVFTLSVENREEAEKALITLPSTVGDPVVAKAHRHRTGPPRTFSCDATLLNIEHSTVGARVLEALCGPAASFDLLRQEKDQQTRYLIRFNYGLDPPCIPWLQCFYVPMDDKRKNGLKVWGIFTPEEIYDKCCFCGKQRQRKKCSSCPFTRVISRF